MILVTGAGGKTGRAIIRVLRAQGAEVRALIRNASGLETLPASGVEGVVGDMTEATLWPTALRDVHAIYHLCPNMHPDEIAIGRALLEAAKAAGVEHFVYHSVLHPQAEAMPHHANKLRVEEKLFESGLSFTILQPTAYMQNLLAGWKNIVDNGVLRNPYPVETNISLVDLDDVAEVAAHVLTEPGHTGATYELVGTPPVTQTEVAETLSRALGRSVRAEAESVETWEARARTSGMGGYQRDTLVKMFRYYEQHGLSGNPRVLAGLLGRPPTTLAEFAAWVAHGEAPRSRKPRYCEG